VQCSAPVGHLTSTQIFRSPSYHGILQAILTLLLSSICLFHAHENGRGKFGCTSLVVRSCDSFVVSFCKNCLSNIDPHLIYRRNTFSLYNKLSKSPAFWMHSYNVIVVIINASISNFIIKGCAGNFILVFLRPVQRLVSLFGSTVLSVRTWCLGTVQIGYLSEWRVEMWRRWLRDRLQHFVDTVSHKTVTC